MADEVEQSNYGFAEAFLRANPQIRAIVDKANDEAWTMDKFLDAVRESKWWRGLSDAQKAYDVERAENPAEIKRKVAAMQLGIRSMALRMGFSTRSATAAAQKFGEQAVRNGWTEEEIRLYVGGMYQKGASEGAAGRTQAELREMAAQYGVKLGGPTANNITRAVLQGVRTVEDYEVFLRDTAKRQYRAIASDLDAGFTVRQILDPYLQAAADELGVNVNTLDTTNAMWTAPIQYTPKGEKEPRPMSQDEWLARMRSDNRYGWDKTQNAQRQAAIMANELARQMGAMG